MTGFQQISTTFLKQNNVLIFFFISFLESYFDLAKTFVLRQFKMTASQSVSGLNRVLPSNFGWLRSAKYLKFTEKCVLYTEKHVLVKNVYE